MIQLWQQHSREYDYGEKDDESSSRSISSFSPLSQDHTNALRSSAIHHRKLLRRMKQQRERRRRRAKLMTIRAKREWKVVEAKRVNQDSVSSVDGECYSGVDDASVGPAVEHLYMRRSASQSMNGEGNSSASDDELSESISSSDSDDATVDTSYPLQNMARTDRKSSQQSAVASKRLASEAYNSTSTSSGGTPKKSRFDAPKKFNDHGSKNVKNKEKKVTAIPSFKTDYVDKLIQLVVTPFTSMDGKTQDYITRNNLDPPGFPIFLRKQLNDKPQVAHLLVVSWTDSVSKFSAGQFELIIGGHFFTFQNAVTKPDELRSKLCDSVRTNGVTTFINAADNFISNLKVNIPIVEGVISVSHLVANLEVSLPELQKIAKLVKVLPGQLPRTLSPSESGELWLAPRPIATEFLFKQVMLLANHNGKPDNREQYPILVISTMSGMGKTHFGFNMERAVLEHANLAISKETDPVCKSKIQVTMQALKNTCHVFIDFNGRGDALLGTEPIHSFLKSRLLARGIMNCALQNCEEIDGFFKFAAKLDMLKLLSAIAKQHRIENKIPDHEKVLCIVHLDEFQLLQAEIISKGLDVGFLKKQLKKISAVNFNDKASNNLFLPLLTGTNVDNIPLENAGTPFPVIAVPFQHFTLEQSLQFLQKQSGLHENWRHDKTFLRYVAECGGNPKLLENVFGKHKLILSSETVDLTPFSGAISFESIHQIIGNILDVDTVVFNDLLMATLANPTFRYNEPALKSGLTQYPYTIGNESISTLAMKGYLMTEPDPDLLGLVTISVPLSAFAYVRYKRISTSNAITISPLYDSILKSVFQPFNEKEGEYFEHLFVASIHARLSYMRKNFTLEDLFGRHVMDDTQYLRSKSYDCVKENKQYYATNGIIDYSPIIKGVRVHKSRRLNRSDKDTEFSLNPPPRVGHPVFLCCDGNVKVDARVVLQPVSAERKPLMLLFQTKKYSNSTLSPHEVLKIGCETLIVHMDSTLGLHFDFKIVYILEILSKNYGEKVTSAKKDFEYMLWKNLIKPKSSGKQIVHATDQEKEDFVLTCQKLPENARSKAYFDRLLTVRGNVIVLANEMLQDVMPIFYSTYIAPSLYLNSRKMI